MNIQFPFLIAFGYFHFAGIYFLQIKEGIELFLSCLSKS